jgi:hypothetical protein
MTIAMTVLELTALLLLCLAVAIEHHGTRRQRDDVAAEERRPTWPQPIAGLSPQPSTTLPDRRADRAPP